MDQDHDLAATFGPVVDRGVHLLPFAETGASSPSAAVLIAPPLWLPGAFDGQPAPQGIGGHLRAAFGQLLGGEGGAEVGIVLAVDSKDTAAELGIQAAVGGLATQAMGEGRIAASLHAEQESVRVEG